MTLSSSPPVTGTPELTAATGAPRPEPLAVRVLRTVGLIVLTAVIVALPVVFLTTLTVAAWTGCIHGGCGQPDRWAASLNGVQVLALLAIPVVTGVAAWRRSRRVLPVLLLVVGLFAAALALSLTDSLV